MAALLTLLAIGAGIVVGLANGGGIEHVRRFRPERWQFGVAGLAVALLLGIGGWSGGWAVLFDIVASLALLVFVLANIRLGGMVLIAAGLILNLVPTVFSWGMPTSRAALERAGVIEEGAKGEVKLDGPRHV